MNDDFVKIAARLRNEFGGNVSFEDVQIIYMQKEQEQVLSNYTFPSHPGKDGIYRIYIEDTTKPTGRRQLSSSSLDGLKEKVYLAVKGKQRQLHRTFEEAYQAMNTERLELIKSKEKLASAQNTVGRMNCDFKRYMKDSDFCKLFISDITEFEIEALLKLNLKRYSLKKKAFMGLCSLVKQTFEFAVRNHWITNNPYLYVNLKKFENMLEPDTDIALRAYSEETLQNLMQLIHKHQIKYPKSIPAYAFELQLLIGLRRGEVAPLRWDESITENGFLIEKELITRQKAGTGEKESFLIVNHTKTYENRIFPYTNETRYFLEKLKKIHDLYYPKSPYLFPAENENGCITNRAVYRFYRRCLKKLNIETDPAITMGPHSFRRNAITDTVNLSNGDTHLAAKLYGNSPRTVDKNYYTGIDYKKAAEVIQKRAFYKQENTQK